MIQKVLVVGGAGYIGGSVTDQLLAKKIPFTVYDNLIYENHYLKPADFIYGDVRDRSRLGVLLPEYSHVIWLAALVGDGACAIRPDLTREINEESLAWLAQYFHGRIIFTSTCSVYGASEKPVTEESPTGPLSVYAETKLAAEKYLQHKDALIFRLGTAFGIPDDYSRLRMDLAINYMTSNAVTKGSLTIFGGNQWRPFIHVKDIGRAIVENLDTHHRGIFNLATENSTILKIGESIRQETGCRSEITEQKFQDHRNYNADVTKARSAGILGASTMYDVSYGIREIRDLILSQRVKDVNHDRYSNEKYLLRAIDSYITKIGYTAQSVKPTIAPTPSQGSAEHQPGSASAVVLMQGAAVVDDRGEVAFVNDFDFKDVKRSYMVSNHRAGFIRAWHAHKNEAKYVMVVQGAALVGAVPIDNFDQPDKNVKPYRTVLASHTPSVLYIPAGYANGAMALTADTKILYFSTASLTETKGDDYRYDARYWDIWQIEER